MGRRGRRRRLDTNIYRDDSGCSVMVRDAEIGDREVRYPRDSPLDYLRDELDRLEKARERRRGTGRDSLVASATRYLNTKLGHCTAETRQSAKSELASWCELYATRHRHRIEPDDVLAARDLWLERGLSPKTINNRVDRLRQLYRALDGEERWTPTDHIRPLRVPRTPHQRIAPALIVAVTDTLLARERRGILRDAKTRARFMVYASTGRRPSEIARTERGDVNLDVRVWVPRDGKGGYTPGIYLNDDMLAAWHVFIDADAFGTFDVNSFVRTIRAAGWPKGVRPYQLRHTIGQSMAETPGVDLADVSVHLGHRHIETTRRHYVSVVGSKLQVASEAVGGRFGWKHGTKDGTEP